MLTDTDAYPPDLQLRSPMPRTKSLHALNRRGKSIDTYARVIAARHRHRRTDCIPRTVGETVTQEKARVSVNDMLLPKNRPQSYKVTKLHEIFF